MRSYILAAVAGGLLAVAPAFGQYVPYDQYPGTAGADPAVTDVSNWYRQFLHRDPEPGGVNGWVTNLHNGTNPLWVEAQIMGSYEGYTRAGSTAQGFAASMFQNVLGRQPSNDELQYWSSQTTQRGPEQAAYAFLQRYQPQAQGFQPQGQPYQPSVQPYQPPTRIPVPQPRVPLPFFRR
jgi:hypothetical protein